MPVAYLYSSYFPKTHFMCRLRYANGSVGLHEIWLRVALSISECSGQYARIRQSIRYSHKQRMNKINIG